MVSHRRRRTILTAIGLYLFAAAFVGYFAVNAFTGNHGLRAQQEIEQRLARMQAELDEVKAERTVWERRVSLLRSDKSLQPSFALARFASTGRAPGIGTARARGSYGASRLIGSRANWIARPWAKRSRGCAPSDPAAGETSLIRWAS